MVDAMPGCAWGWLRPSRAVDSRAAQAGGLGKREAGEPAPCLSHQPGVHRCGIDHLGSRAMQLERLAPALAPTGVTNPAAVEIDDLAYDTSAVAPGAPFFCVRGARVDGHELADDALAKGAVALVVERRLDFPVPQLVVADSRRAMAPAAVAFFDDPNLVLYDAAVSGTNGKTLSAILSHA